MLVSGRVRVTLPPIIMAQWKMGVCPIIDTFQPLSTWLREKEPILPQSWCSGSNYWIVLIKSSSWRNHFPLNNDVFWRKSSLRKVIFWMFELRMTITTKFVMFVSFLTIKNHSKSKFMDISRTQNQLLGGWAFNYVRKWLGSPPHNFFSPWSSAIWKGSLTTRSFRGQKRSPWLLRNSIYSGEITPRKPMFFWKNSAIYRAYPEITLHISKKSLSFGWVGSPAYKNQLFRLRPWTLRRSHWIYIRSTPLPVTVTTRIITFLVRNPYKPSFATGILGGG